MVPELSFYSSRHCNRPSAQGESKDTGRAQLRKQYGGGLVADYIEI